MVAITAGKPCGASDDCLVIPEAKNRSWIAKIKLSPGPATEKYASGPRFMAAHRDHVPQRRPLSFR
jgi:hypothetical protein